jgi:nicotinic acetylcholine receptor, invertebrate
MELLAFLGSICFLFCASDCESLPPTQLDEEMLINRLLTGYNKNIRPNSQVPVDITAKLQQIVAIDERQQIMTSSSFISQSWFDERLSWSLNASNTSLIVVMLPVKSLWIPDTMILNSADANGYLTVSDYSLASVAFTGQVYMILPALTIKTKCTLYVRKFPFDQQMCSINLTSWSQGTNRIAYVDNSSAVIDTSEYNEHPLWKLDRTDMIVIEASDRSPFEYTYNNVICIQLFLQRKSLFFMMNGVFACLILNCVTLLSYALPFLIQINLSKKKQTSLEY